MFWTKVVTISNRRKSFFQSSLLIRSLHEMGKSITPPPPQKKGKEPLLACTRLIKKNLSSFLPLRCRRNGYFKERKESQRTSCIYRSISNHIFFLPDSLAFPHPSHRDKKKKGGAESFFSACLAAFRLLPDRCSRWSRTSATSILFKLDHSASER